MKAFGTWGTGASFSLGGVIGCTLGLAGIALGGWVPLVGFGVAIVVGIAAGAAINAWDRATGDFNKEIAKVSTKTVSEKLLTGAAITGYVALAAVTVTDVANPATETSPTAIIQEAPIEVTQSQPTLEPSIEATVEPVATNTPELLEQTIIETEEMAQQDTEIKTEFYASYACIEYTVHEVYLHSERNTNYRWESDGIKEICSDEIFTKNISLDYLRNRLSSGLGTQSEEITIAGKSLQVVVQEEIVVEESASGCDMEVRTIDYFDAATGIRVRYDGYMTYLSCAFHPDSSVVGLTNYYHFELVETDLPLGEDLD